LEGGGRSDEQRRRSGGGAAAGTRIPARIGAELVNVWHVYLLWDLVGALGWLVDSGFARRAELTDGGNGVAAGNFAPTSLQLSVANKRAWELSRCTKEAGAARVCGERRPEVEFTVSTDGRQWRFGGTVLPRAEDGEALL
jgi:hypothetical protein